MLFYKDRLIEMRCKDRNFYSFVHVWNFNQVIENLCKMTILSYIF